MHDKSSRISAESASPSLLTEGGLVISYNLQYCKSDYLTFSGSLFPYFMFLAIAKFSLIFFFFTGVLSSLLVPSIMDVQNRLLPSAHILNKYDISDFW